MCPDCRPEFLLSCYVCGHVFREFESFYIVKRLMDRGGVENRWYGIRYGRCQDCPRPYRGLELSGMFGFGELKRRGGAW